jgi:hypothetical protein
MLARPVTRAPLPGRPAWLPSGFTVLDRSGQRLVVLDRTLVPVARIPAPVSDGQFGLAVSADGSLAAVANLDRTVVMAADGTMRWQWESVIKPQGLPQKPAVYIGRQQHVWLYLPDGDHIAVLDARTGEEIDRTGLSSCIGAGEFVAHPDGVHLGLSVAQGQDGTNSYWLHLDEGRIAVRELPGETLAGVAPSGGHYLDLPHVDTQLAIRRFADDRILASCAADDIPGFKLHDRPGPGEDACDANGLASRPDPSGYGPNDGAGAYLDDDHVLVGVFTAAYGRDDTELHLVLSTRSLQWTATVDYGQHEPPPANSIVPGHDGRWLTYDWQTGIATLWEPDHITQEAEPALFDMP